MELVSKGQELKGRVKRFKKIMENAACAGKSVIIFIFAMTLVSFLICRVFVLGDSLPCGIALLTALMYRNRMNIYLLPVMILSMWSCIGTGVYISGDLAAILFCGITFILIGRKKWGLVTRGLIASAITVICNSAYYLGTHMLYRFDMRTMIFEVIVIMVLCGVFHLFLISWFSGDKPLTLEMEKVVAVSVSLIMLMLCSAGFQDVMNSFSATMIGALFIVLLVGYSTGIPGGVLAASIAGITMIFCANATTALLVPLLLGGLTAGFFVGQGRIYSSICFAGACLAPGLLGGNPEFNIPMYAPLLAGGLMVLFRQKWLDRINPIWMGLRSGGVREETAIKEGIENTLRTYEQNFESLASIYSGRKDFRSVMGYQFTGMAQAIKAMRDGLNAASDKNPVRYQIKMGKAAYARDGKVSGDSYVCRELPGRRFVAVLSDGMGKGEAAGAESSLAANTLVKLLEVGFEPQVAIKTINSILIMQPHGEIFSTIDMGILEQDTGRLKLYKVGAAATFIKRNEKVAAVKMSALPMGIVDGLSIDFINVRLRHGDQLIMVSDGIIDSRREDMNTEWLIDAIASIKSKDPQTMADLIISRTVENYGLKEKDDLTVLSFLIAS